MKLSTILLAAAAVVSAATVEDVISGLYAVNANVTAVTGNLTVYQNDPQPRNYLFAGRAASLLNNALTRLNTSINEGPFSYNRNQTRFICQYLTSPLSDNVVAEVDKYIELRDTFNRSGFYGAIQRDITTQRNGFRSTLAGLSRATRTSTVAADRCNSTERAGFINAQWDRAYSVYYA